MKRLKLTKKAAIVLVLAAIVVSGCGIAALGGGKTEKSPEITAVKLTKTNLSDTLSLSGTIYSDKTQNVYSTLTYPVKEIYVETGDKVKAGDVLAVLDVSDLEYEIRQAENNYENTLESATDEEKSLIKSAADSSYSVQSAKLNLEKLSSDYETLKKELSDGTSTKLVTEQKNIDTQQQSLENAKTTLELKKTEYENNKRLFEAGAISKSELDTFENAYNTAVTNLNSTERLYNNALNAYTSAKKTLESELVSAKNSLESAELNYRNAQDSLSYAASKESTGVYSIEGQKITLEKLKAQYEDSKITAGIDGVVTEMNAVIGASANGILFVIEDDTDLYASINVKEHNLSKVKTGQPAIITTDATGNSIINGEVSYISPKATGGGDTTTVEFETYVSLKDYNELVKIGMNAFVNIITASARDVYAVSTDAVITRREGSFIYTVVDKTVTEVPVTKGLETAMGVEISGDLTDGMLVITNPSATTAGSVVEVTVQETPQRVMRAGGNAENASGGPQGNGNIQEARTTTGGQAGGMGGNMSGPPPMQ